MSPTPSSDKAPSAATAPDATAPDANAAADRPAPDAGDGAPGALLAVEDLVISFTTEREEVVAVDRVSFEAHAGRTLGIVGESGCGKSVTSLAIMRLLPRPAGKLAGGRIVFEGRDLAELSERDICAVRGNEIAMIFQEPMTSLNPVFSVGSQIAEALVLHRGLKEREAKQQAVELLRRVGIPSPEDRANTYPHEMSGGMKQRVMIAMAISCEPKLLIADEPTTALDVTIQAQILDLLRTLQRETGLGILFISHDLGVIAEMAHEVAVMYAGRIVERADVETLFARPQHPYTIGLFNSIPRGESEVARLAAIPGRVPDVRRMPKGCRFHPRCPFATDECRTSDPALRAAAVVAGARTAATTSLADVGQEAVDVPHVVACHRAGEVSPADWVGALLAAAR